MHVQFLRGHHGWVVAATAGPGAHPVDVVHLPTQVTATAAGDLTDQGPEVLCSGIASRSVDLGVQV